jgi:hypothetical protein
MNEADFRQKYPGAPGCCNSCHDDEDAGYCGLCAIYEGEMEYEVCCALSVWFERRASPSKQEEG